MPAILFLVGDYLNEARVLLQDTRVPYRYDDTDLKMALGNGMYEARRLRPDLFPFGVVQQIGPSTASATEVHIDVMYHMALVFYMVGQVMLREEEESVQQVARAYRQAFGAQLVSVAV